MRTPFSDSDEAKAHRATLLARKITQADEGRAAMDDYHRTHQAMLDRTAKLRALRLAQPAVPVEPKPAKPKAMRLAQAVPVAAKPPEPKKPTKPKRERVQSDSR